MTEMKLLIINADDFGLEEEINAGIIKAHREGVATSTSIIANGRAFDHAVALAREAPGLDVGAHLTLTRGPSRVGSPVLAPAEVPSLVRHDGLLPQNPTTLAARIALGTVDMRQVEKELRAQMAKIRSAGIRITHIDSHQHIHMVPAVFRVVTGLAHEFGIAWVRLPARQASLHDGPQAPLLQRLKSRLLSGLAIWNSRSAAGRGLHSAQYHVGIEFSGRLCVDTFERIVTRLPDGIVELSCHPGSDNAQLGGNHPWGYMWEQELSALCSSRVLEAIEKSNIKLTNYSGLNN